MRPAPAIWLLSILVLLQSCRPDHEAVLQEFENLKSGDPEEYTIVYAYSTYLSTTTSIGPGEAVPLILELISMGYHTEARYCIDNLKRNGIHSSDLLALRGLCYHNELQPDLAMADLKRARKMDPDNAKITALLDRVSSRKEPGPDKSSLLEEVGRLIAGKQYREAEPLLDSVLQGDKTSHRALYLKGLAMIGRERYDSALYYLEFASSSEPMEQYGQYAAEVEKVIRGQEQIRTHPGSFSGYILKSRGLASMQFFDLAHKTLSKGLQQNPDNLNLLLAKALVWVQAGKEETARQYLRDLEQRGVHIDPALKENILRRNPHNNRQ